jgi:xylulokinase
VLDPTGAIAPFCDATGAYLPLLCVMNATGVTEEVRRAFASEHETLARAAAAVEPGARGVLWLPYLNGERVPDWSHASGVIAGLRAGSLDAGLLYRAAIEGVALNLAWGIERMRAQGVSIESARLAGGASRSELWGRILADVLEIPLVRLSESESAALGAALQALWAVRRAAGEDLSADTLAQVFVRCDASAIEPDERVQGVYRDASARFREWAERAFG